MISLRAEDEKTLTAAYCRESEGDAITALCNQSDIVKEFISRQDLKFSSCAVRKVSDIINPYPEDTSFKS